MPAQGTTAIFSKLQHRMGIKSLIPLFSILLLSCSNYHTPLNSILGTTQHYEGLIESYSVGPNFYPEKQIEMTLSFESYDYVHGFWVSADNPNYRHYVKGDFTTLRTMYGGAEGRRVQKEEREKTYGASFREMSRELAPYRIRLTEYTDYPGASNSRTTDNAFYVYNFEGGKLQGSYYAWRATTLTNGKDTWHSGFTTKFHLKSN